MVFMILGFIQMTSWKLLVHITVFSVENYYPTFPRRVNRLVSDKRSEENISKSKPRVLGKDKKVFVKSVSNYGPKYWPARF